MNKDKLKALEMAISQIEKNFGKGSIMRLGEDGVVEGVQSIPTGSLTLDIATGIGGLPRGRVVEIYGPESSGKTTLALNAIAQAQNTGGTAAFIDAEHALDVNYAKRIGVKIEDLLVSQPDTGEQALEVAEALSRSGALDIIVIDSVAALVPKAEIEGDMGDSLPGLQARLMSQALRKLTASISKSNTTVVFINQIRMKIGVMFGSPETTTGGNALKFYASMRLDIRRIENIKDNQEIIGGRVRVKVVKNKMAPPFGRPNSTSTSISVFRGGRDRRPRRRERDHREGRCVVQLRRQQDRPGKGEREGVSEEQCPCCQRDRGEDHRGSEPQEMTQERQVWISTSF